MHKTRTTKPYSHLASRFRLLEVVGIFLKHGADVDVKNSERQVPAAARNWEKKEGNEAVVVSTFCRAGMKRSREGSAV